MLPVIESGLIDIDLSDLPKIQGDKFPCDRVQALFHFLIVILLQSVCQRLVRGHQIDIGLIILHPVFHIDQNLLRLVRKHSLFPFLIASPQEEIEQQTHTQRDESDHQHKIKI